MPNRLAQETSPYLLQHAHNPVDWFPWGSEALDKAKAEDKPIMLSIGYAACHWCHVMERESFEDPETARAMNEAFVNVKVDREERPDLDSIYMAAVQALTGHGGWPMTVFLTPDGKPFFGGTYFPPEPRHGMPAFRQVLAAIQDAWGSKRDEIEKQGAELVTWIGRTAALQQEPDPLDTEILSQATTSLLRAEDPEWGGFGGAPKFPQPMTLEFLLRMHARGDRPEARGDHPEARADHPEARGRHPKAREDHPEARADHPKALETAARTLDRMARGGIFDHVGGGFHRYAVDRIWLVPHFEKMLYDNALLLRTYTRAWLVTGSPLYRATAERTAAYIQRDLRHPDGGFFSSQDADSEGVEGKFYVWPYEELIAIAGEDMPLAVAAFAASPHGNWEGTNVLWRPQTDEEVAAATNTTPEEVAAAVERTTQRLFEAREKRTKPATDDKVLAAWNGLAIAALAEAGRTFQREDLIDAARTAADFVLANLRMDGRLLRAWRDGRTSGPGFLDDHALMADACLTLYETTFEPRWWTEARALVEQMIALFADPDAGGFFDTGSDAAETVVRPKDVFDNAVPCGNSAASDVLLRMAALAGEPELENRAVEFLRIVRRPMLEAPSGFGHALCALDRYLGRQREVAIVGDPAAADTRALIGVVHGRFLPDAVLAAGPAGTSEPPLLRDRPTQNDAATAYVCEDFVCKEPVTEPTALAERL